MAVDAVIFDWGGTLTRWHDIDFHAESLALAQAVVNAPHHSIEEITERLHEAGAEVWGRSREQQRSSTLADLFEVAGLEHDPELLRAYLEFWEPHTFTDPDAAGALDRLRAAGLRVGVLSNTLWPRAWHDGFFRRDGILDKIDASVYTSELPWTKPSPLAFRSAMESLGLDDPGRCVYVGDRLFDDVHGAHGAGMLAIHVPHSRIPQEQRGHTDGIPDAVAERLSDIPDIVVGW
ncbi:MAG: HAD family hydrolase [Nocardioidaceae bacterium]